MAILRPLRAIRYRWEAIPHQGRVVAPPYDVVDAQQREQLLGQPYNIAHIDLAPPTPGFEDPYQAAAQRWRRWREEGILVEEPGEALFPYEQRFLFRERLWVRRGLFARLRLEPLEEGSLYPHEDTFPGPKEDRFRLMVATRCALSPVFGLFPDGEGAIAALLAPAFREEPWVAFEDAQGQEHRLWRITEKERVEPIVEAFGAEPILIADGHHRYETALAYRDWLARQRGEPLPEEHPAQYTLFACVALHDEGLLLLPTHRCLRFPQEVDAATLRALTRSSFHWEPWAMPQDEEALPELLGKEGFPLAYWDVQGGNLYRLRPWEEDPLASLEPHRSPLWRRLPVVLLHRLLLQELLIPALGSPRLLYAHRVGEALNLCHQEGCHGAFFLPPLPKRDFAELALLRERLPQKSTYFFPKLPTGLVFYPLE